MVMFCLRVFACLLCIAVLGYFTRDFVNLIHREPEHLEVDGSRLVNYPQAEIPILLANTAIQEHLNLEAWQTEQIENRLKELLIHFESNCPRAPQKNTLTDEDLKISRIAVLEFAQIALQETTSRISEILTEEQLERLEQLKLQRQSLLGFQRPDLIAQLQLTHQQRRRISELPILALAPGTSDEARQKVKTSLKQILSEDQFHRWELLNGPEFGFKDPTRSDLESRLVDTVIGLNASHMSRPPAYVAYPWFIVPGKLY